MTRAVLIESDRVVFSTNDYHDAKSNKEVQGLGKQQETRNSIHLILKVGLALSWPIEDLLLISALE